jgi:hypothetical protein
MTSQSVPNTAMAVITDVGGEDNIHPVHKQPVGARLALGARALAYKESVIYSGPVYTRMSVDGDRVTLFFSNTAGGLESRGSALTGFTIAGADPERRCETLRRAFRNASDVESQESCIHLSVSDTARTRSLLRCSPLLSRQNKRKENGYKDGYKNRYKNRGRSHVDLLRTVYAFQDGVAIRVDTNDFNPPEVLLPDSIGPLVLRGSRMRSVRQRLAGPGRLRM